jgi:putative two-component system response regulator
LILKHVLAMLDQEHAEKVSLLSQDLARYIGLSEQEVAQIGHGALYHDVGKIAIPKSLLESTEKFTDEQRKLMQRHVEYGVSLLSVYNNQEMEAAKVIVASHHERWDGQGYPYGLMGEAIPLYGRIVAICDVFDALSSKRPYKEAWSLERVFEYMNEQSGKAFDPRLVEAFVKMMCKGVAV